MEILSLELLPYLLSLAITLSLAVFTFRRRSVLGAQAFFIVIFVEMLETVGFILELGEPTLNGKMFWDNVQWFTTFLFPVATLYFIISYIGRFRPGVFRWIGLLAVVSLGLGTVISTDLFPGLGLISPRLMAAAPFTVYTYAFGPIILIASIYSYTLLLSGFFVLGREALRQKGIYRLQTLIILVGLLIPVSGTVLVLAGIDLLPNRDILPFTFAISNIFIVVGLFRYGVFDILPIARSSVKDYISDPVAILDAADTLLDVNPAFEGLFSLPRRLLLKKPIRQFLASLHPLDESVQQEFLQEACVVQLGQETTFFDIRSRPFNSRLNVYGGRLLILHDITAHMQMEEKLREHRDNVEANFDAVFESSPVAMLVIDETTNVVMVNLAGITMCGGDKSEILQHRPGNALRCVHRSRDSRGCGYSTVCKLCRVRNGVEALIAKGGSMHGAELEMELDRNGGPRRIWMSIGVEPLLLNGRGHWCIALEDVTERKQAEQYLRLQTERVQVLLKLNQLTDVTHKELTEYALEEAVRITQSEIGYLAFLNEDETVLTMHSWSKQAMKECAIIDKPIQYVVTETGLWGEAVRQRRPVITNDYAAPNPAKKGHPQGHVPVRRHMNVPVFAGQHIVLVAGVGNKQGEYDNSDAEQLTLLMEGMWRLIEHRQAEEALRENELKYRTLFETADDAILLFADGRWVDCNAGALHVFGCNREQIIGAHPIQFSPPMQPEGRPSEEEAIKKINLAFAGEPQYFEWEHCRLDGTPFAAEVSLNRLDLQGNPHMLAIVRDISKRKQVEQALRQKVEELHASNNELEQFSRASVGRELRMIELKEDINELCRRLGEPLRHATDQLQTDSVPGAGPAPAPPGGGGYR
ncbi:MAG: PAS domain S-box protein [Anaerolineales bacterium]|nr:PAS domain S-box protein [Anaerolineales bacterium]